MARRNANGEGTLYHRRDGRWEGAIYAPTVQGTRKRVRCYGRTRAEAYRKLLVLKEQISHGVSVAEKSWRLDEYLDYWLREVAQRQRQPTSYLNFEVKVRRYIRPGLGNHQLRHLSVQIVQQYFNQMLANGCTPATVKAVRNVLSAVIGRAEREELVARNVVRLTEIPSWQAREVQPWTAAEALRFLEQMRGQKIYAAYLMLLTYGLRRGELLGLRWRDIDFQREEIHIRQQLQVAKGVKYFHQPKTRAGRRDLPLLANIAEVLHAHRSQPTGRKQDHDLVFTDRSGSPFHPTSFTNMFGRNCKATGIRPITLHALRHTAATLLKNLGVPLRDVQQILGHTKISITQEIYQHSDMPARRRALQKIATVLTDRAPEQLDGRSDVRPHQDMAADDGERSRQSSRQPGLYSQQFLTGISSSRRDLELISDSRGYTVAPTLSNRLTEAKSLLHTRTQTRILGIIAVSVAVN